MYRCMLQDWWFAYLKCRSWILLPTDHSSHLWKLFCKCQREFSLCFHIAVSHQRRTDVFAYLLEGTICIYQTLWTLQESGLCALPRFLLVTISDHMWRTVSSGLQGWAGMRWGHMTQLMCLTLKDRWPSLWTTEVSFLYLATLLLFLGNYTIWWEEGLKKISAMVLIRKSEFSLLCKNGNRYNNSTYLPIKYYRNSNLLK